MFIDLDRERNPVVFATPGKGKATATSFKAFLEAHGGGGSADRIEEVVYTLSPAFLGAIGESYENARQTVDWFHLVQLFTTAADEVREAEN